MRQKPIQTVGILGAGQLGLMLSDALLNLGAKVRVLDPFSNSPTALRTNLVTQAAFDDRAALEHFFSQCDRVTYEFEHIPTQALRTVLAREEHRNKLWPSVDILEIAQNRIAEKSALQMMKVPLAKWEAISQFSHFLECKKRWSQLQKKQFLKLRMEATTEKANGLSQVRKTGNGPRYRWRAWIHSPHLYSKKCARS